MLVQPTNWRRVRCLKYRRANIWDVKSCWRFHFLAKRFATLKALITFASWAHLNIHKKLIGWLNVNNFYDDLFTFFNHQLRIILFESWKNSLLVLLLLMSYLIFYKLTNHSQIPGPWHWNGWLMMVTLALVKSTNWI